MNLPKEKEKKIAEEIQDQFKVLFGNSIGEMITIEKGRWAYTEENYFILYRNIKIMKCNRRDDNSITVSFYDDILINDFRQDFREELESYAQILREVCKKVSPFLLINLPRTGETLVNNIKNLALKKLPQELVITITPILPTSQDEPIYVSFDYENKHFQFFKMFMKNFDHFKTRIEMKLVENKVVVN